MSSRLVRTVLATLLIASFGLTNAHPARADQAAFSRNIIIGAALAAVGIIIGSNVAHKQQLATTVAGYTSDGATVYADGRVVYGNGSSYYPGDHGQQIACRNMSCTIYNGNSSAYNTYYQWNGSTWGPAAAQPQPQPQYYPQSQPQPQYYPQSQPQPQYYPQSQGYGVEVQAGYNGYSGYGYPGYYGGGAMNAYAQAYDAYYRAYQAYYRAYYDYYNRNRGAYAPAYGGHDPYMRHSAPQGYCCDPASNPYAGGYPGARQGGH
jgi:hypothetical protein